MTIFGMEFKHNLGKMIAWLIVLGILTGLLLAFHPLMIQDSTKDIFQSFTENLGSIPKAILGLEENIDYENYGEYMAFIFQYLSVLVVIFAMQIGANALSREQSTGNIEYLYSNPVSRGELVTQKFLANLCQLILFLLLYGGISFALATIFQPDTIRKQEMIVTLVKIFGGFFASSLIFMSVGMFLSALMNGNGGADGISVLLVLLSGIAIIGLKIMDMKDFAQYIAIETFKPIHLVQGSISAVGAGISLGVLILSILFTYGVYNTKELKY